MEKIEGGGWRDWENLGCALAVTSMLIAFGGFAVATGGVGLIAAGYVVASTAAGLNC